VDNEFELDGTRYTYTPMTTKASLHLKLRLAKVAGPAVQKLFSGETTSFQEAGSAAFAEAIQNLDEATLDAVILAFGKQCEYTDPNGTFRLDKAWEQHFKGRLMSLYRWLGECATREWEDFFAGLAKLLGAPQAPKQ
jgi:hypothetical protein